MPPAPRDPLHPATPAVSAGRPPVAPGAPLNAPLVLTSTYHPGGPAAYAREHNPTWLAFEEAVGARERRAVQPGQQYLPPGLVRVSVGVEHVENLWADLGAALDAAGAR